MLHRFVEWRMFLSANPVSIPDLVGDRLRRNMRYCLGGAAPVDGVLFPSRGLPDGSTK
jgi:hypothetical protein